MCARLTMQDVLSALQTVALFVTFFIMAYVAIRQLRAYVFPRVKGMKTFSLTEPIDITIGIKNAGQTPARECESSGVVFIGALPLDDNTKMPEPGEAPGNLKHGKAGIYPQEEMFIDCECIDSLNDGIIEALRIGRAAIYVAGEARYKDMFNFRRRSEFCWYIDPAHTRLLIDDAQGRQVTLPPIITFTLAHVWNRAT
jgi:hypothetical protein